VGARPFIVGVTDLVHRLGSRRPVRRVAPLDDLAISTAAVAPGEDVVADLELESISNGIVAYGTVTVSWTGACRRCLEPVRDVTVAEVREVFERRPVEGETYPLDRDLVDLEPMVRDAVLLALPLAPLCASGCRGLDWPQGIDRAPDTVSSSVSERSETVGPEAAGPGVFGRDGDGARPGGDTRWAALDQLRFD
jgi:uncharacterized protein